jgi:hypothetical protein
MEKHQNKFQTSNVIFETTINCLFSLKPANTVFPPNYRSNSRYGVTKSLCESRNMSTLAVYILDHSDGSKAPKAPMNDLFSI